MSVNGLDGTTKQKQKSIQKCSQCTFYNYNMALASDRDSITHTN